MSRKPRNIAPGLPNHIVHRGNNRRRLFSYPKDYRALLRMLDRALERTDTALLGLCLMPNHLHLILTPPSSEAGSDCVKRFAERYTRYRNDRTGGSGKGFEQRFYSKPIVSDDQLMATTLYIEANPVDAGIVDHPRAYRWCTWALHAGAANTEVPAKLWSPSAWYLSLGESPLARADAYAEAMASYLRSPRPPSHHEEASRYERRVGPHRQVFRPDRSRAG